MHCCFFYKVCIVELTSPCACYRQYRQVPSQSQTQSRLGVFRHVHWLEQTLVAHALTGNQPSLKTYLTFTWNLSLNRRLGGARLWSNMEQLEKYHRFSNSNQNLKMYILQQFTMQAFIGNVFVPLIFLKQILLNYLLNEIVVYLQILLSTGGILEVEHNFPRFSLTEIEDQWNELITVTYFVLPRAVFTLYLENVTYLFSL